MRSTINMDVLRTKERDVGGIANHDGFYREYHIQNMLGVRLWCIDYNNNKWYEESGVNAFKARELTVRVRNVKGRREYNSANCDISGSAVVAIKITLDMLAEGPLYVNEIDLVLCTEEWLDQAYHPNSNAYLSNNVQKETPINNVAQVQPLVIYGNDPSGRCSKLYAYINDVICAFDVSNCTGYGEGDQLIVAYRNVTAGGISDYTVHSESLVKLTDTFNNPVWEHGGISFSNDVQILKEYIRTKKILEAAKVISKESHNKIVEDLKTVHANETDHMKDRIKELANTVAIRDKTIAQLTNVKYSERAAEIEINKLEHEKYKLAANADRDEIQRKLDMFKMEKEVVMAKLETVDTISKTITTAAKAVMVIAPMLYAAYKLSEGKK